MRISTLIYVMLLSTSQLLLAAPVAGQVLEKRIDVDFKEASTLSDAISQLERQAVLFFAYESTLLDREIRIGTTRFRDTPVREVLNTLLNKTGLTYKEEVSGTVTLLRKQQNGRITGRVTDRAGAVLTGATVRVNELHMTTRTDEQGNYSLSVQPGTYTLAVSYISYVDQQRPAISVSANGRTVADFMLDEEQSALQEVVVVAYGQQRRKEITGSVAEVDATSLSDMPVGQFSQQLQGKIAGVQVSQVSGQPGRGMAFRIRGAASLSAGNSPLFVIDGLPITGDINNINPAEIASFTILKDASATALYGSRASNGVILITTKQAKAGESSVSLDAYFGMQRIPENKVPRMMNAREYAQYMKDRYEDAVRYESNVPPLNEVYQHPEQYGEGTNWYDVVTRSASTQNYDLTVLSAKERSRSAIVAGYQSQAGVLVNTKSQLLSLRVNNEYQFLDDRLHLGFNIAPSYRKDLNNRLTTDGLTGIFLYALESSPLGIPVNPDGTYPYNVNSPGMVINVNPYAQLMGRKETYTTTRILGNAYADIELIDGLTLKANIGLDKGAEIFDGFTPSYLASTAIATGRSTSYDNYSWTGEANLNYTREIGDHRIELLAGYSGQQFDSYNNAVGGQDFVSDDVPYLSAAAAITSGSTSRSQYSLVSAIGRVNYAYRGKYLLSGSIRNDGSSRFGNNRKYGSFPSLAAGWVLSEESFMKPVIGNNFLKLRASYGITGNNNIGNYTYIPSLGNNINYFANGAVYQGVTITSLGNQDLAWERNKQWDLGVDLRLLHNRLGVVYDYYHRVTDGMIQSRPVPRSSGFSSIRYNTGQFEFWGHELTVDADILTGNLKWQAAANITIDRNRIKSLVDPGYIDYRAGGNGNYFRNQVGHPLGLFCGYVSEGLYQDENDLANAAHYKGGSVFSDVGTLKFRDLNNDGVVEDVNDRTFIGDPTPDFRYGMTNQLRYQQLDLNISVSGQVGGDLLNVTKWTHLVNMDGARNLLAEAADRWRSPSEPGSGVYPRTKTNTTAIGRYANSQWVENGSYFMVNNIALGYTLPFGKQKAQQLRVFASVQRPFVFTSYSGMNPEANLTGLDATQGIGVDVSSYPIPRTFALGISLNLK